MLQEHANVRQIPGEPRRRWFGDDYFDLIVWLAADDAVLGFQLCYDKQGEERALNWNAAGTSSHHGIDTGEDQPMRHKATPIAVADGVFDAAGIGEMFEAAAAELPEDIRLLVRAAICDHGRNQGGS
ncbi:MAG: hypothetical protein A2091_12930 [Desulfuromonadales bacterium GWD2_61_12]|nr:MAG: hypothetical protein A2005_01100 [Desulfuromonadales bacterium GWC2_61_20]OGR34616.1 MAG: hypothetical protein A2091_12930 [Desulfuromonadales bacterium GWD2_61_12]HAD03145.1 hypothetical protein [Desulfuromonas sp.]HBT83492.1 hypothetical protein [Desulfuromonas sp.]